MSYSCSWCKKENITDCMVKIGQIPEHAAICGDCKIEFGRKVMDRTVEAMSNPKFLAELDKITKKDTK